MPISTRAKRKSLEAKIPFLIDQQPNMVLYFGDSPLRVNLELQYISHRLWDVFALLEELMEDVNKTSRVFSEVHIQRISAKKYLRDGVVVDRDVLLKDNLDGYKRYKIRQLCGQHFKDFNQTHLLFRSLTHESFHKIDSIEIAPGVRVRDVMAVRTVISDQNPIIQEPIFQTARLLMKISDLAKECESAMYACNRFVSQTHRNRLEDTFKRISTNYIHERDAKGKKKDEEGLEDEEEGGLEDEYDDYGEDIYESESEVESDDDFDHPPRYVPSNPSYIPKKGFY